MTQQQNQQMVMQHKPDCPQAKNNNGGQSYSVMAISALTAEDYMSGARPAPMYSEMDPNMVEEDDITAEMTQGGEHGSAADVYSTRSIKDHHSKIQMDYYDEPRQYNPLGSDSVKYPTHTHLVGVHNKTKEHSLFFAGTRERADVDVGTMKYQD